MFNFCLFKYAELIIENYLAARESKSFRGGQLFLIFYYKYKRCARLLLRFS